MNLCTSGLAAAILDFWCGMWTNDIEFSTTEKFDLENIRIALEILFLWYNNQDITLARKLPVTTN